MDVSIAEDGEAESATRVQMGQNRPNPFNPATTIAFSLPMAGSVTLTIHSVDGRRVATPLAGAHLDAGPHTVTWQGHDTAGRDLASGVYFYRLQTSNGVETKRMVLVR